MLDRLAETFIAGVELLEAEGRVARDQTAGLAAAAVVVAVCGVTGLIGLVAAAVGATWVLSTLIGTGGALAIVGTTLLAASALVGMITLRRLRRPPDPFEDGTDDRAIFPEEYPE